MMYCGCLGFFLILDCKWLMIILMFLLEFLGLMFLFLIVMFLWLNI